MIFEASAIVSAYNKQNYFRNNTMKIFIGLVLSIAIFSCHSSWNCTFRKVDPPCIQKRLGETSIVKIPWGSAFWWNRGGAESSTFLLLGPFFNWGRPLESCTSISATLEPMYCAKKKMRRHTKCKYYEKCSRQEEGNLNLNVSRRFTKCVII